MAKVIGLILVVLLWGGYAWADDLKVSIWTMPPDYLKAFPLDTISETEMISKAGPPTSIITIGGKQVFVYKVGQNFGERTFTYFFENGVITDVLYNDNGPYNGMTARKLQKKSEASAGATK